MRRLLPPLLVLAFAVLIGVRLAGRPDREAAVRRLGAPGTTAEDVRKFLEAYGGSAEHRWAAAQAYFRLQDLPRAIATVWGTERGGPYDPAAMRRFAELGIRELGWNGTSNFAEPTVLGPLSLCALADAGRTDARAYLERAARTLPGQAAITYYLAAYQRGTRLALDPVLAGLRARDDKAFEVAAAMASMGPDPYPEREADLVRLREAVNGVLRQQDKLRWASSCVGLGRSETEEAREVLRRLAERLSVSVTPHDREDGALAASGVVASGDWSLEPLILPFLTVPPPDGPSLRSREPNLFVASWYAEAVQGRMRRGDPRGADGLQRLWGGPSEPGLTDLRGTLATRLFLQDDLAEAPYLDGFVRDLISPEVSPNPVDRVIGHAARLRRGEAAAAWDLLALLEEHGAPQTGDRGPTPPPVPHAAHPSVTVLRALLLYAGSSPH